MEEEEEKSAQEQQKQSTQDLAKEEQTQLEIAQKAQQETDSIAAVGDNEYIADPFSKPEEEPPAQNPTEIGPPVKKVNFARFISNLYTDGAGESAFNPYNIAREFIELNEGDQKYEMYVPEDDVLKEQGFNEDQIQLFKKSYEEVHKASFDDTYMDYFAKKAQQELPPNTSGARVFGFTEFRNKDKYNKLQQDATDPNTFRGQNGVQRWFTESEIAQHNTQLMIDGEFIHVKDINPNFKTVEDVVQSGDGNRYTIATDIAGRPEVDENGWFYLRPMEETERANSVSYGVESIFGPKPMYNSGIVAETLKATNDFAVNTVVGVADFANYGNWISGATVSLMPELARNLSAMSPGMGGSGYAMSPYALHKLTRKDSETYFQYLMSEVDPISKDFDKFIDADVKQMFHGYRRGATAEKDLGLFESPMNSYVAVLDGIGQIFATKGVGWAAKAGTKGLLGLSKLKKGVDLSTTANRISAIESMSTNAGRGASYSYNMSNVMRSADESAIAHGLTKAESMAMQTLASMALALTERLTGEQFMPKMAKTGQKEVVDGWFKKAMPTASEMLADPAKKASFIKATVTFMRGLSVKADKMLKTAPIGAWPKRFITGGRREAVQEGSEEQLNVFAEDAYDNVLTPEDITRYNNTTSANMQRVGGGAFIGAITGGLGGVAFNQKTPADQDRDFSAAQSIVEAKGDGSLLRAAAHRMFDANALDFTDVDSEGNPVNDKSKSVSADLLNAWLSEIDRLEKSYQKAVASIKKGQIEKTKKGLGQDILNAQILDHMTKINPEFDLESIPAELQMSASNYSAFASELMVKEAVMAEKAIMDITKEIEDTTIEGADESAQALNISDAYKLADIKREIFALKESFEQEKEAFNIDIQGLDESSVQEQINIKVAALEEEYEKKSEELEKDKTEFEKGHPDIISLADKVSTLYNVQDFRDQIYSGERADFYVKKGLIDNHLKEKGVSLSLSRYLKFEEALNSNVKQQKALHEAALIDNKNKAEQLEKLSNEVNVDAPLDMGQIGLLNKISDVGLTPEQREKFDTLLQTHHAMLGDEKLTKEDGVLLQMSAYALRTALNHDDQNLEMTPQLYVLSKELDRFSNELEGFEQKLLQEKAAFNKGPEVKVLRETLNEIFINLSLYHQFNDNALKDDMDVINQIRAMFLGRADYLIEASGDDNIELVQLSRVYDDILWRSDVLGEIIRVFQEKYNTDLALEPIEPITNPQNWEDVAAYKKAFTEYEEKVSQAIRKLKKEEFKELYIALEFDKVTRDVWSTDATEVNQANPDHRFGNRAHDLSYFFDLVRGGTQEFDKKYAALEAMYDIEKEFTPSVIQKEYTRWLYSFLYNDINNSTAKWAKEVQLSEYRPSIGWKNKGKKNGSWVGLAQDMILFEGYGGVGKTQMIIKTLLEIIAANGDPKNPTKFIYSAPLEDQLDILENDGINKIGKSFRDDADFDIKAISATRMEFKELLDYLESVAKDKTPLDQEFLILDEATLMKQGNTKDEKGDIKRLIHVVKAINADRTGPNFKVLLIGDTGQLFGDKEFNSILYPEKRRPLDAVYRSGKKVAEDIQSAIRSTHPNNAKNKTIKALPNTTYSVQGRNIEEGYRWSDSDDDTYKAFLRHVNTIATSSKEATPEQISFITSNGVDFVITGLRQIATDYPDDPELQVPNNIEHLVINARNAHGTSVDHVYASYTYDTDYNNPYGLQWHKALLVMLSREKKSAVVHLGFNKPKGVTSTALAEGAMIQKYETNNWRSKEITDPEIREIKREQMETVNNEKIKFNRTQAGEETQVKEAEVVKETEPTPSETEPVHTTEINDKEEGNHDNLNEKTSKEFEEKQTEDSRISLVELSSMSNQEDASSENVYTITTKTDNPDVGEMVVRKDSEGKINMTEVDQWFDAHEDNIPITKDTPILIIKPAQVELGPSEVIPNPSSSPAKGTNLGSPMTSTSFNYDESISDDKSLFKINETNGKLLLDENASEGMISRALNSTNTYLPSDIFTADNQFNNSHTGVRLIESPKFNLVETPEGNDWVVSQKGRIEYNSSGKFTNSTDGIIPGVKYGPRQWVLKEKGIYANTVAPAAAKIADETTEDTTQQTIEKAELGSDIQNKTIADEDVNSELVSGLRDPSEIFEEGVKTVLDDAARDNTVTIVVQATQVDGKPNEVRAFVYKISAKDGKQYRTVITNLDDEESVQKKIDEFIANPESKGNQISSEANPDDNLMSQLDTENTVRVMETNEGNEVISNKVISMVRERADDRNRALGKDGFFQLFTDMLPSKTSFINIIRNIKKNNVASSIFTKDNNLPSISIEKFATAFGNNIENPKFVLRRHIGEVVGWNETKYLDPYLVYFKGSNFEEVMIGALSDNGKQGRLGGIAQFDQLMDFFKRNPTVNELSTQTVPIEWLSFPYDSRQALPASVSNSGLGAAVEHWGENFQISDVHLSTQEADKEGAYSLFDKEVNEVGDYTWSGRGFILISPTMTNAELNAKAAEANDVKSLEAMIKRSQVEGEFNVIFLSNRPVGIADFNNNVSFTAYGQGKTDTAASQLNKDLLKFLGWEVTEGESRPVIDTQFSNEHQAPYILSHIIAAAPAVAGYVNSIKDKAVKAQAISTLMAFLGTEVSPAKYFLKVSLDSKGNIVIKEDRTRKMHGRSNTTGNSKELFVQAIDNHAEYTDEEGKWHAAIPTLVSVTTMSAQEDGLRFIDLSALRIAAKKESSGINISAIEKVLNSYNAGQFKSQPNLDKANPVLSDPRRGMIMAKKGVPTEEFMELSKHVPENFNWESYFFDSGYKFQGLHFMMFMGLINKASKSAKYKASINKAMQPQLTLNGKDKQWTLNIKRADNTSGGITMARKPFGAPDSKGKKQKNGFDTLVSPNNDVRLPNPVISLTPFLDIKPVPGVVNPKTEKVTPVQEPVEARLVPEGSYIGNGDNYYDVVYTKEGEIQLTNKDVEDAPIIRFQSEQELTDFMTPEGGEHYDIETPKPNNSVDGMAKKYDGIFKPVSNEDGGKILSNIFGVDAWADKVNFHPDLITTGNIGLVARHMMWLHTADGKVDKRAVKHESVHYVLSYFLDPEEYRQMISAAKEAINARAWVRSKYNVKKGDDISEITAHEFMANAYENFDKTLEWANMPTFVRNIFKWLRNSWSRISNGNKVTNMFIKMEGGQFQGQDRTYRNDIIDGEETIFTKESPQRGRAIARLNDYMWKWGNSVNLQSHIDLLENATRRELLDFDPAFTGRKTLVSAWHRAVAYIVSEEAGIKTDIDKQAIKDNKYKDFANFSQEKASKVLSGQDLETSRIEYLGYLTLKYNTLLRQAAFPEMQINQGIGINNAMEILTNLKNGTPSLKEGQSTTNKINTSFEQSKVNAFRTMSQDVNGMISSTRLLTRNSDGTLTNTGGAFVDMNFAKTIFVEIFENIKKVGHENNLGSVKIAFRNMIKSSLQTSKKDNALSIYLRFFADINESVDGIRVNNGQFTYNHASKKTTTGDNVTMSEYSVKSILDYVSINKDQSENLKKYGWEYLKLYEGALTSIFSAYASVSPKNFWVGEINEKTTIDDQLSTIGYNATKEFRRRFQGQINQALFRHDEEQTSTYLKESWIDAMNDIGTLKAYIKGKKHLPVVELADGSIISGEHLETKYKGSEIDANNPVAMAALTSVFTISGLDNVTLDAMNSIFAVDSKGKLMNKGMAGELKTLFFRLMATEQMNRKGDDSNMIATLNNSVRKKVRIHPVIQGRSRTEYGQPTNISEFFRDSDNYSNSHNNVVTPTTDFNNMENISLRYFGDIKSPFVDLSFYNESGELIHIMTLGNDMTNYLYRFNNHQTWISGQGGSASSIMNEIYQNPLLDNGSVGVVGELSHINGYNNKGTAANSFVEGDHIFTRFKYLFIDPIMDAVKSESDPVFFLATTKRADKPHLYAVQLFNSLYNNKNKAEGIRLIHRSAVNTALESAQRFKQNFPDWGLSVPNEFDPKTSTANLVRLARNDFKIIEKNLAKLTSDEIRLSTLVEELDYQGQEINKVLLADVLNGTDAIKKDYDKKLENFVRMINDTRTLKGKNWFGAVDQKVNEHYQNTGKGAIRSFYGGKLTEKFDPNKVHPAITEFFYTSAFNQYFFDEAGTGSYYHGKGINFDLDLDNGKHEKGLYDDSKERMFEDYVKRGSSQTTPGSLMVTGTRLGMPNSVNSVTIEDAPWLDMKEATDGLQFANGLVMEMMHASYGGNSGIGVHPFAKPKTSGFFRNDIGGRHQLIRQYDKSGLLFITGEMIAASEEYRTMAEMSLLGKNPDLGQDLVSKLREFEAVNNGKDPFQELHKWISYDIPVEQADAYKNNMTHIYTMTSSKKKGSTAIHKWDEMIPGNVLKNHSYDAQDLAIVLELTHETEAEPYASILTQISYISGVNGENNKAAISLYNDLKRLVDHKIGLLENEHVTKGVSLIKKAWQSVQDNLGNFSLASQFARDKAFSLSMPIIDSATQGVTSSLVNKTLAHKISGDKLILATATGLLHVYEGKDGAIYKIGDNIPEGAVKRDLKYMEAKKGGLSSFNEIITKNIYGKQFGLGKESLRTIFGDQVGVNLEAPDYDQLIDPKWTGKVVSKLKALLNADKEGFALLPLARTLMKEDARARQIQADLKKAEDLIISTAHNKEEMSMLRERLKELEILRKDLTYFNIDELYDSTNIATEEDNDLYIARLNGISTEMSEIAFEIQQNKEVIQTVDEQKQQELNSTNAENYQNLTKLRQAHQFYSKGMKNFMKFDAVNEKVLDFLNISEELRVARTKYKMMGVINTGIIKLEKELAGLFSYTTDGEEDFDVLIEKLATNTVEFNKTLYGLMGRIPATGPNSAAPTRVVSFMHDSMNVAFVSAEVHRISGSDNDGDGSTFWGYNPHTNKSSTTEHLITNKMLATTLGIWRDPLNFAAATTPLKVDEYLRERADGLRRRAGKLSWSDPSSDIVISIENDVGQQLTGISANSFKKYSYYSQSKINRIQRHSNYSQKLIDEARAAKPEDADAARMAIYNHLADLGGYKAIPLGDIQSRSSIGYPNLDMTELYGWDRNGDRRISDTYEILINGAVDNASNPFFGKMNINKETIPFGEVMTQRGIDADTMFGIFEHPFVVDFFRKYREGNNIRSKYYATADRHFTHKFLRSVFLESNPELDKAAFLDANKKVTTDEYYNQFKERFKEFKNNKNPGVVVKLRNEFKSRLKKKYSDVDIIKILDDAQEEFNTGKGIEATSYFFMLFQEIGADISSTWNINNVLSVFKELKTTPFDNWRQKKSLYKAISIDKPYIKIPIEGSRKKEEHPISSEEQLSAVIKYLDWFHKKFAHVGATHISDDKILKTYAADTDATSEEVHVIQYARAKNRRQNSRLNPWLLMEEMPHIGASLNAVRLDNAIKQENHLLQLPQIRDKFFGKAESILKPRAISSKHEYNRFMNKWNQFVGGKYIEDTTIKRKGKSHTILSIDGNSYDVSKKWQRALFMNDFVDYINNIQANNRDKQFLNALKTQDKVLYIDRNYLMSDREKSMLLAEFDALEDNLKTNLFYYSLIVSGIKLGSQSLSEFISPTKFYGYNEYVKTLETSVKNESFDDRTDWLSPENINESLNTFYLRFTTINNTPAILKSLKRVVKDSEVEYDNDPMEIIVTESDYIKEEAPTSEEMLANAEEEDLESAEEEIAWENKIETDENDIRIYNLRVDKGDYQINRLYVAKWVTTYGEDGYVKKLVAKRAQGTAPHYYNPMSDAVNSPILGGEQIDKIDRVRIEQIREIEKVGEFKLRESQVNSLYYNSKYVQITFNAIGEIDKREDGTYVHKISDTLSPDTKHSKRSFITKDVAVGILNEHINLAKKNYEDVDIIWSTEFDSAGWVEDGTVYFNPNLINMDTPYHEFGHLFMQTVKQSNYEDYIQMIKTSVDSKIYDQIVNDYGEIKSETDMMEEAFNTLHGLNMAGEDMSEYLHEKKNVSIFKRASLMFMDFINDRINKWFGKDAGEKYSTNRAQTLTIWDSLEYAEDALKKNKYERKSEHTFEKIRRHAKAFYSINSAFTSSGELEEFIAEKRENLEEGDFVKHKKNIKEFAEVSKRDGQKYFWDSIKREDRVATDENINDYVDNLYNARNGIADIIAKYADSRDNLVLSTLFTKDQLGQREAMIDDWISDAKENQYDHIEAYNEESATKLGIWNPFFRDENIVMAYKDQSITGREAQIRLFFPTTSAMNKRSGAKLDEAFGKPTRRLNVSLNNSEYDSKMLKIGMFAANMREMLLAQGKELYLDTVELGLLGPNTSEKIKANTPIFISDILPSIGGLTTISNFMDNIGNEGIKNALLNKDNFKTELYNISYLEQLAQFMLRSSVQNANLGQSVNAIKGYVSELNKYNFDYDSRQEVIDIIRDRQTAVKQRHEIMDRVASEEDLQLLRKDPEWNYLALAYKETQQRWNGIDMRFKNTTARLSGASQWTNSGVDIANVEIASAMDKFVELLDHTKNDWKVFVKSIKPMFDDYIKEYKAQGKLRVIAFENTSSYYENLWVFEKFKYIDAAGTESVEEINTMQLKNPDDGNSDLKPFEKKFITQINEIVKDWVNTYNERQPSKAKLVYRKGMMPFALAPHERLRNKMIHNGTREDAAIWWNAYKEDHTNYENYDLGVEASMLRDNPSGFLGQYGRSREDKKHGAAIRYKNLGLEDKNGEWIISRGKIDQHKRAEDDIEALLFQVSLTTFKNNRLPEAIQAFESMQTVLWHQEQGSNNPLLIERAWLNDVFKYLIFNEMKTNKIWLNVDFDKAAKRLKSISSKIILGAAPASAALDLIASTIVNLTTSFVKTYGEGMFSPVSYGWASGVVMGGLTAKKISFGHVEADIIDKGEHIIEDWNVFNSNINTLARDHRRRHTSSSWLNEEHIFFFHHEVERALTMTTFLAQIKEDKILDYFEWKLDENGDRYLNYNIDKEIRDVKAGVRKHKTRTVEYLENLVAERTFYTNTQGVNVASKSYMASEIRTLRAVKAKLTGAYEDATKGKLDTSAPFLVVASMKKYIISRANRIYRDQDYESNSVSFYMNKTFEYVDEDGKKHTKTMSVPVPITETAFWGSLVELKNNLRDIEGSYGSMNIPGAYDNLSDHHKAFIKRGMMDVFTFAVLLGATVAIWGDDEKKNELSRFLTKIAYEVLGAYNIANYIQAGNGAIPIISLYKAITALQKVMMGDIDGAKYQLSGISGVGRTIKMFTPKE